MQYLQTQPQAILLTAIYSRLYPQTNQQQVLQTPQEARRALYDAWTTSNIFPQSTGQASYNETSNPNTMNTLPNQYNPASQTQNLASNNFQDSNNQMNTMANNYQNNPPAPEVQTLSGAATNQSTSQQRTSGGISHLAGTVTSLGATGFAYNSLTTGGGIYNAGYFGAALINSGMRNGLKF